MPDDIGEPAALVTCDVSFISATLIVGPAAALLQSGGRMVILVKPQFEVGRGEVGRGGVVRDPEKHAAVIESIGLLAQELNLEKVGITESPITGPKGNREFLVYLKKLY